jgi:hypothetical protein
MSRSRKKHPGGGIAVADSDKPFKTAEHKRERRCVRAALARAEEPRLAIYGNPWKAPKDGKQYWFEMLVPLAICEGDLGV